MWTWMAIGSALLLGVYDVAKKHALRRGSPLWVLLGATVLSTLMLGPFFSSGPACDHLRLMLKAILVSSSWITGMLGLKYLPITTVSTIKGARPMIIVVFSMILFGERLSLWQWAGVLLILAALMLLARSSRREGIDVRSDRGILYMVISVLTGAASALYDKHLLVGMDAVFVQCWSSFYISAVLALCLLGKWLWSRTRGDQGFEPFRWDWTLVLIAALITVSDFLYFHAIQEEGAMLSVISMLRRCSIAVTFILGAILYREKRIREKALEMAMILAGAALLVFGS